MSLCKSGQIVNCCHPNALMTLKEYLLDYSSEDTKRLGEQLIEQELAHITNEKVLRLTKEHLKNMEEGKRDFRF